jgi:hypothetical protein
MKLTLTKTHIKQGIREDCLCCPLALVLREATGLYWRVDWDYVRGKMLLVAVACAGLNKWHRVVLPESCVQFVRSFDTGTTPKPFEFEFNWTPPAKDGFDCWH